jgi:hypothetical protein
LFNRRVGFGRLGGDGGEAGRGEGGHQLGNAAAEVAGLGFGADPAAEAVESPALGEGRSLGIGSAAVGGEEGVGSRLAGGLEFALGDAAAAEVPGVGELGEEIVFEGVVALMLWWRPVMNSANSASWWGRMTNSPDERP